MHVRFTISILFLLALTFLPAAAQVPDFPDSLERQSITAKSERYEATHATSIIADYRFGGLLLGAVRGSLYSTTTLLQSASTKDQVDALVDVEYPLTTYLHPFLLADGTLTNDLDRVAVLIPGLNNTATSFSGVGLRLTDSLNYVGLAAGGAYNRQLNVTNVGAGLYGEAGAEGDLSGYFVKAAGRGRMYDLAPLRNSHGYFDLSIRREFEEGAYGDLQGRYVLSNTDQYVRREETEIIQYGGLTYNALLARRNQRLDIASILQFPMGEDLGVDILASIGSRGDARWEVNEGLPPLPRDPDPFRYDINSFSIGSTVAMRWTPDHAEVAGRLEYLTNEERNLVEATLPVSETELKQKRARNATSDFVSQQLLLGGSAMYRIGNRDTFSVDGSLAIFRFDTPAENFDDRDEQSIQGHIRYAARLSPYLGLDLVGQFFLTHLVYLSGRNSNDNNWNRIFRLAPTVRYAPDSSFRNDLQAEVTANYTEYDFEGRSQNIRGRSSRQLSLRDSIAIAITPTLRLTTVGEMRISERSTFSWAQFAESPLERTRTEVLNVELLTSGVERLLFGAGGQVSRVKIFRADRRNVLEPFSDRTSVGPTARIEVVLSERSSVSFTGWWEHRFDQSELVSRVPWMFLSVATKL